MKEPEQLNFISQTQLSVFVEHVEKSSATIINADGVKVKKIALLKGNNTIELGMYHHKNYSIKIVTDNNVFVKKI